MSELILCVPHELIIFGVTETSFGLESVKLCETMDQALDYVDKHKHNSAYYCTQQGRVRRKAER